MKKKYINIFGGGCAGFSFIRRSQEVKDATFKFYLGTENDEKDHYWGFWRSKYSHDFDEICLKWNKWKIISQKCNIIVFDRYGYKKKSLNSKTYKSLGKDKLNFINFNKVNISSSKLRKI